MSRRLGHKDDCYSILRCSNSEMSNSIRLGIAGGRFGEKHAIAFSKIDGITLAGVADLDEKRRTSLLDTYKFENSFESFQDMVDSGGLDAVVICLPTEAHERAIGAAFDANLHVLCEKPPASNESEMSRIVSSAGFCGRTFMWARQQRFSPPISAARSLIADGELGDIYRGDASWNWGWWPFENSNWRGDRDKAGGALLDIGIHMIDSLWYAMGCPDPVEAMASRHNLFLKHQVPDPDTCAEDSVFGMIRFKNGASLNFSAMFFGHVNGPPSHWGAPVEQDLRLFGTKGSIDLVKGERIESSPSRTSVESYAKTTDEAEWFVLQAQEFIDSIREEREPENSGKQGLTLMKMLDALALSAKEKRAVPIKITRSLEDLFGGL